MKKMKHIIIVICIIATAIGCESGFWLTPDQQGERLLVANKFQEAAKVYVDPFRKGVAFFRAGDFKAAVSVFERINTAQAYFNKGNSLVMLGKYTDAVSSYDRALDVRSKWKEAEENREIARIRAERVERQGGEMTGGMLGADGIVFNEGGKNNSGTQDTIESASGQPLSDEQLRALWLRRVQTEPADFLRAKFAYQYSKKSDQ
jgi:Ca-activated chloride channel homolog